jgi:hypothetical protein
MLVLCQTYCVLLEVCSAARSLGNQFAAPALRSCMAVVQPTLSIAVTTTSWKRRTKKRTKDTVTTFLSRYA